MIKHILWDLDGTLFDTYPALAAAFVEACGEWGHSPDPAYVRSLAEISLAHCVQTLARIYDLPDQTVEQNFSQHYAAIPYSQQPLMPGARVLCDSIRAAGGKNLLVTHRGARSTLGLLAAQGLRSVLDDIITGDDGYPKKPDPTSMKAILARNGLDAREVLAIGDRQLDIAAGQAAGLRVCLLGRAELEIQPDFQVDHLDSLLDILRWENQAS